MWIVALVLWIGAAPAAWCQDGADGVRRLAERLLGPRAGDVTFELASGSLGEGNDSFAVLEVEDATRIYGESTSALARGLFEYLRRDVSVLPSWWSGTALQTAAPAGDALPVATPSKGGSPFELRLYLEPEAFAYAAAFWDAARLEREVDLAALRGFNAVTLPLGRDLVMTEVYKRLGLEPQVYTTWSVGAAFRAFGWCGEAVGWMGPQSLTFAEADAALARRALGRMRDLGIEPVLPAFTGVLPAGFAEQFPGATFHELPEWAGLGRSVLLDAGDPLFDRLAELYYEEQERAIGTSRLYFGSPLGEKRPPLDDEESLARMAGGVSRALALLRPDARWIVSAWPFRFDRGFWTDARIAGFLDGAPKEQIILLDKVASSDPVWERTGAFFDRPFLWGVTPSFGGRQRLGGPLEPVADELRRAASESDTMTGFALAHESPGVDPLRFEYLCDQLWTEASIDADAWIESWVRARYGAADPRAVRAWRRILVAAYGENVIDSGPSAIVAAPSTFAPPPVPYDASALVEAWRELVALAEESTPRPALIFDLVDIGRQVLSNATVEPIGAALEAFAAGDVEGLAAPSARTLAAMTDLDELLATHPAFLLGAWLQSAGGRGGDDVERAAIAAGARALVTHFGPIGSSLRDWGGREWSGLVGAFHRERWRRLFEALATSAGSGTEFDATEFDGGLAAFEREWAARANPYSAVPMGDPVSTARRLLDRWGPELSAEANPSIESGPSLVDVRTPPLARWRIGNDRAIDGARLVAELEFAAFLREAFGVGFDLIEWRASGWDEGQSGGAREAVVSNLATTPGAVRDLAERAGARLALVSGADGFGTDTQAERARRRELERLVTDLELGAVVLDARLGALRESSRAALLRTLLALRERASDLLVIARGLDLGEVGTIAASSEVSSGPWFFAPRAAALHAHGEELARGRADSRLSETLGVPVDGRLGWTDALVWQAFGLAPLFAFDVGGAPWLLEDTDLVRFARLLELFDENRALLAEPVTLASSAYASGAVARGNARAQIVVVRNLAFETVTIELPVGPALGLDSQLAYEARQWHPSERYLGRVPSGDSIPITVAPFGCVLIGLSADGFEDPIVEGTDQLWIPGPEGTARRVVLFGEPGGEVRIRLRGDASQFQRATVDGVGVDAVLGGGELRLRFPGEPADAPTGTRALGAFELAELPSTSDELVGAARASIVSSSPFTVMAERAASGFAAVDRARRLVQADLERHGLQGASIDVLQSKPRHARRLRVTLPDRVRLGQSIAVAVEWIEGGTPGTLAVTARIPGRGLVGARTRFGPPAAPTYVIELRPEDAGREIDLWILDDAEEPAGIERARAWLREGPDARAARTLVLE